VDLGNTVDGRDLNVVVVGDPAAEKKVWIIARQHPGETMAEWLVEGLLGALLDQANPIARSILEKVLYNRAEYESRWRCAWQSAHECWRCQSEPRMDDAITGNQPGSIPRKKQDSRNRLRSVLDIHGDEALPYVFVAGSEMIEGFTEKQAKEQQVFVDSFCAASPDFQTKFGYEASKYNEDMLKLAKYIGHTFKCVSLTLELPFKDNANLPDANRMGWCSQYQTG
jgi:murein tripeptide amidase MpaA